MARSAEVEVRRIAAGTILPLIAVRDTVLFPGGEATLCVQRKKSLKGLAHALRRDRRLLLAAQRRPDEDDPRPEGLHRVGTVALVVRRKKLKEGERIVIRGLCRAIPAEFLQTEPLFLVRAEPVPEPPVSGAEEAEALLRVAREELASLAELGNAPPGGTSILLARTGDPGEFADIAATLLPLRVGEAQYLLEALDPVERLRRIVSLAGTELEVLRMQERIRTSAEAELARSQREHLLRQQLETIRRELGEGDLRGEEIEHLRRAVAAAALPESAAAEALRRIGGLERLHPESADAASTRSWLDWVAGLPWNASTRDETDLARARRILDEEHFGLDPVKERIIEEIAVHRLSRGATGRILCLAGPPGVGKTSLGRSVARAMGRRFVRVVLGGLRDDPEIRGSRHDAAPGRIIQGLRQAGARNPVFMLDEVDKIGDGGGGDLAAALLEVLDPEQNDAFVDTFLDLPFDLSDVLFIVTANQIETVAPALRDRMEVITIPGYTGEEKLGIVRRFLLPRQLKAHGLADVRVDLSAEALRLIISRYTFEAGVRDLERHIGTICRRVARSVVEEKRRSFRIGAGSVEKLLGRPRVLLQEELERNGVGTVAGLAWTPAGGEIMFVEATAMPGNGAVILTGSLGGVMRESAVAALSLIRSRAAELGIPDGLFGRVSVHVHVPAGSIPKDGPSAGVTIATALLSALSGTPVRRQLAMTGEITLRGRVLPVGGVRDKILAAVRAGVETVIVPEMNLRDCREIPRQILRRTRIVGINEVTEAFRLALAWAPPAPRPIAPALPIRREEGGCSRAPWREGGWR